MNFTDLSYHNIFELALCLITTFMSMFFRKMLARRKHRSLLCSGAAAQLSFLPTWLTDYHTLVLSLIYLRGCLKETVFYSAYGRLHFLYKNQLHETNEAQIVLKIKSNVRIIPASPVSDGTSKSSWWVYLTIMPCVLTPISCLLLSATWKRNKFTTIWGGGVNFATNNGLKKIVSWTVLQISRKSRTN